MNTSLFSKFPFSLPNINPRNKGIRNTRYCTNLLITESQVIRTFSPSYKYRKDIKIQNLEKKRTDKLSQEESILVTPLCNIPVRVIFK